MLTIEEQDALLDLKKRYSMYALFSDKELFPRIIDELSRPFVALKIDKTVGIEARGFILGGAVAYRLQTGFVVVRKGGNMYKDGYSKKDVLQEECVDYSGKRKVLEIEKHKKAIVPGDRVLIIDDWFEAGGQGQAVIRLVERAGGVVVGIGIMLDEMTSVIRDSFVNYNLHALIKT